MWTWFGPDVDLSGTRPGLPTWKWTITVEIERKITKTKQIQKQRTQPTFGWNTNPFEQILNQTS